MRDDSRSLLFLLDASQEKWLAGRDSSSPLAHWLVPAAASLIIKTPGKCHCCATAILTAFCINTLSWWLFQLWSSNPGFSASPFSCYHEAKQWANKSRQPGRTQKMNKSLNCTGSGLWLVGKYGCFLLGDSNDSKPQRPNSQVDGGKMQ